MGVRGFITYAKKTDLNSASKFPRSEVPFCLTSDAVQIPQAGTLTVDYSLLDIISFFNSPTPSLSACFANVVICAGSSQL